MPLSPLAEETPRPGEQGRPGRRGEQRGQAPRLRDGPPAHTTMKGPVTPPRSSGGLLGNALNGKKRFFCEVSVTRANHHCPPGPGRTPLLTGPQGSGGSWPEAGPEVPKRKEKVGPGEKEAQGTPQTHQPAPRTTHPRRPDIPEPEDSHRTYSKRPPPRLLRGAGESFTDTPGPATESESARDVS